MNHQKHPQIVIEFSPGTGKSLRELFNFIEPGNHRPPGSTEISQVFHMITREQVEAGDLSEILEKFSLNLPEHRLRELQPPPVIEILPKLVFCVMFPPENNRMPFVKTLPFPRSAVPLIIIIVVPVVRMLSKKAS